MAMTMTIEDALRLILPMAKGYAAEHRVGSNLEYIDAAEEALSALPDRARDGAVPQVGTIGHVAPQHIHKFDSKLLDAAPPAGRGEGEGKRPEFPHEVTVGGYILLERKYDTLRQRLAECAVAMESDRSKLAGGLETLRAALRKREWLRLGRGSYEYNDDRWRGEFGDAYDELQAAIETLAPIAANWTNCPRKASEVQEARTDWKQRATQAEALLAAAEKDAGRYRWLRDSHNQGANTPEGEGLVVVTERPLKEPRYIGPLAWQLLDKAIEAALKPTNEAAG